MLDALIILAFVALLALGFPLIVALAIPSITYILMHPGTLEHIVPRVMFALNSDDLVALPMFLLINNILASTGGSLRIWNLIDTAFGRWRGGYAQTAVACSIFPGRWQIWLSDTAKTAPSEIETMRARGFRPAHAAAMVALSAVVRLAPPIGIPFLVFSEMAFSSILILIGWVLPCLLLIVMLMAMTAWLVTGERGSRVTKAALLRPLTVALPALLTPIIIFTGITGISGIGWGPFFLPEIGSIAFVYVLLISWLFYGPLTRETLIRASYQAIRDSSGIFIIIAISILFNGVSRVVFPQELAKILHDHGVLLPLLVVLLLIVGAFLEPIAAIIIVVPIVAYPFESIGIDPIQLGVVMVLSIVSGLVTPIGRTLSVVSDIANVSKRDVVIELAPYYIPIGLTLALVTYVPILSTWVWSL